MPQIQALRGLRYNLARVGSLSSVVAPPYDVVDAQLQQHLYDLSPFNFIRLELTRSEPGTMDPDGVYQQAANLYRDWIRQDVLQREPDPALYVYHQIFEYAGRTYTRRGFMARVKLVRFGEGEIYPHEQTHAKAKDDRLKLTRACQANMSQIFGLYPDADNAAQNALENCIAGQPAVEAVDHLGVKHRLWAVTNPAIIAQVSSIVDSKPMFVADGHHRYETACNYRDELAQAAGGTLPADHPANYVLSMMVSMDDPGLIVLPTHRLLHGIPAMSSAQLTQKLTPVLDCQPAGSGPEAAPAVWRQIEELNDQGAFGLYSAADKTWTLVTASTGTQHAMADASPNQSRDWQGLGVAMLHNLIIDRLLGLAGHPKPTYVHLVQEVIDGLQGRLEGNLDYQLAALVMPASVEDIRRVSLHNERMPAKSTYFYPKLLSGLVVHSLEKN
ncbi:MAG: DUF1015 domain-containing protein [Pirellulaceae bacterium]|nr:DUF1015 domain-containing protein [Pirellulaceae bacterium]